MTDEETGLGPEMAVRTVGMLQPGDRITVAASLPACPFSGPFSGPFRDPAVPLAPEQLELRRQVLKEVENDPAAFCMSTWVSFSRSACRTTRCLAGWTLFLADGRLDRLLRAQGYHDRAIALLGLTREEFNGPDGGLFYASEEDAVARLRELAAAP